MWAACGHTMREEHVQQARLRYGAGDKLAVGSDPFYHLRVWSLYLIASLWLCLTASDVPYFRKSSGELAQFPNALRRPLNRSVSLDLRAL